MKSDNLGDETIELSKHYVYSYVDQTLSHSRQNSCYLQGTK